MERFFGFDLGDAESAVSVLKKEKSDTPRILNVRGASSFITAYARLNWSSVKKPVMIRMPLSENSDLKVIFSQIKKAKVMCDGLRQVCWVNYIRMAI